MLIWVAASFLSSLVKGLCGFANAIVFNAMLNFANNPVEISPVCLLIGAPTNMVLSWKGRKLIRKELVALPILLILIGSFLGALALKNGDARIIKMIFGFFIAAMGGSMLLKRNNKEQKKPGKLFLYGVGLLSGLLCGLYGVGAMMSAYFSRVTEDTASFKANMCFVFVIENVVRLVTYAVSGLMTAEVLLKGAVLLPVSFLGLAAGMLMAKKLDEKKAKLLIYVLLIISGVVLIAQNL